MTTPMIKKPEEKLFESVLMGHIETTTWGLEERNAIKLEYIAIMLLKAFSKNESFTRVNVMNESDGLSSHLYYNYHPFDDKSKSMSVEVSIEHRKNIVGREFFHITAIIEKVPHEIIVKWYGVGKTPVKSVIVAAKEMISVIRAATEPWCRIGDFTSDLKVTNLVGRLIRSRMKEAFKKSDSYSITEIYPFYQSFDHNYLQALINKHIPTSKIDIVHRLALTERSFGAMSLAMTHKGKTHCAV